MKSKIEKQFNKAELGYIKEFVEWRMEHYVNKGGTNDWYYEKMMGIIQKIDHLNSQDQEEKEREITNKLINERK